MVSPFLFRTCQFSQLRILVACLLFAIAIAADEARVFLRFCLFTLERNSLRIQPQFLYLQLLVLGLSTVVPSTLIVIFSSVFIERFVSTVHKEIACADQRSGCRLRPETLPYFYEEKRKRGGPYRTGDTTDLSKKAKSVSVISDAVPAFENRINSDPFAGSSLVRRYRMHPSWRTGESAASSGQVGRHIRWAASLVFQLINPIECKEGRLTL